MTLISVIIPVYNCEKYIAECLKSVVSQSYKNIEIICIDDASKQNEYQIIQKFMEKDDRIKYIKHQTNFGLGGARNTGIKHARGEYLVSVDSDDIMYHQLIETAYKATDNATIDVISFGYERVDESGHRLSVHTSKAGDYKNGEFDIFNLTNPAFWNKMWRKSLYDNIKFPVYTYYQDLATTPRIYYIANSVRVINDVLYKYRVRMGSTTFSISDKHIIDFIRVFRVLYKFMYEEGIYELYKSIFDERIMKAFKFTIENAKTCLSANDYRDYIELLMVVEFGLRNNLYQLTDSNLILESSMLSLYKDFKLDFELLPISALIKTYNRPQSLERLILSIIHYERFYKIRFTEILIGDDSHKNILAVNADAINKIKNKYNCLNIRHIVLNENTGLSYGRNQLVEHASQDYILLLDDDFIMDSDCDIKKAFAICKENNIDMLGGWLKNKFKEDGSYEYWAAVGELVETNNALIININEVQSYHEKLVKSDYLLNFYIAKKELLLHNKWQDSLLIEEHHEFFYRLHKLNKKIYLSQELFIKHADGSSNPSEYKQIRYGKSRVERYVLKSLALMNKKARIVNRIQKNKMIKWKMSTCGVVSAQKQIPLREPILGQKLNISRLTSYYGQCFCGYYDLKTYDCENHFLVYHRISTIDTLPIPNCDYADIILKNIDTGEETYIDRSYTWNHQQGAMAHFYKADGDDYLIFNNFDAVTRKYISKSYNIWTKEFIIHHYPIAALNTVANIAASVNFSRLYDYRPGYGYNNILDPYGDMAAPEDDGIFIYDFLTDSLKCKISYAELKSFLACHGFETNNKFVVNHITFSPKGTKAFILLREFSSTPPHPTYSLVMDMATKKIKKIFGFVSHYHWKDEETIIASGSTHLAKHQIKNVNLYEININTLDYKILVPDTLTFDGHCSYSPDRKFLLYDSYTNPRLPYRRLFVYSFALDKIVTLGYFYSPKEFFDSMIDLRCDLHPRWSDDGKYIIFDSIHEGFRAVYSLDCANLMELFMRDIREFSFSDYVLWYATKYVVSPLAAPAACAPPAGAQAAAKPQLSPWKKKRIKFFKLFQKIFYKTKLTRRIWDGLPGRLTW